MSPTTRVRAIVLILSGCCVVMTGCSNPGRDRMIGKWEASVEMTEDEMANMMPSDNPIVAGLSKVLMKSMRAEIQWEFAADDSVSASGTGLGTTITRQGSWRFVSADETSTKLQILFDNEEAHEVTFTFLDPDTFEAALLVAGKLRLNRVVKFKRVVATP